MYHQIFNINEPNIIKQFQRHISYIADNFPVVLPGEEINNHKQISICLTFDDAYVDFYYHVYPLLQSLNLKALLAIPTSFIQPNTNLPIEKRLSVIYPAGLTKKWQCNVPLCTWHEIREMVNSGHIQPASHSVTHANLTDPNSNIFKELHDSKQILQKELLHPIKTFVYPFGQMTMKIHHLVRQHYQYGIRIGSAINLNWHADNGLIYRINADSIWRNNKKINKLLLMKYIWKYYLNRLRNK